MTDSFAHRAAEWDTLPKIKMTEKFVNELLKYITPQKTWKALEIGSGTGLVGLQLEHLVDSIVFEDTSEAMLSVLRRKLNPQSKSQLFLGEINEYKKADIDFIFSCMALHHIHDTTDLLEHLARICKPGAYVAICDLTTEDGSFHNYEPIPHKGFDLAKLSQLFNQFGFEIQTAQIYNKMNKMLKDGSSADFEQFILIANKK